MATRSTIAIELTDGTVKQVYSHWDGYLSWNGRLLLENYSDPKVLEDLINLGDISSLRETVGEQHPFDYMYAGIDYDQYKDLYGKMTTFYGRDRGEDNTSARTFPNFEMYRLSGDKQEYDYILRNDGQWYVNFSNGYIELTPEMVDKKN